MPILLPAEQVNVREERNNKITKFISSKLTVSNI